jgi:lycopene beta-cyclase
LNSATQYNFIICGAGCAGLSLLMHMIESGKFSDKKILLIDKEKKNKNDRTWCFWEKEAGLFEPVVYKKWNQLWFYGEEFSDCLSISPYEYKMIRGIDFYNYCFEIIGRQKNITVLKAAIRSMHSAGQSARVVPDEGNGEKEYSADYVFSSILFEKPALKKNEYYLLQHFKGWRIETAKKCFDPSKAVLMDFRPDQRRGTTFVYVMPFTETEALVEYTLFSHLLLKPEEYDSGLKDYLRQQLQTDEFIIKEEESGTIPMTNHKFASANGRIINIGTAGGQTKASSGYTFHFIQKNSAAIVQQLIHSGAFIVKKESRRFHFYDSVLLDILYHNSLPGKKIFTDLFKKNKPQTVLRFLDNETSLTDELKIISTLPTLPFLKAALKRL